MRMCYTNWTNEIMRMCYTNRTSLWVTDAECDRTWIELYTYNNCNIHYHKHYVLSGIIIFNFRLFSFTISFRGIRNVGFLLAIWVTNRSSGMHRSRLLNRTMLSNSSLIVAFKWTRAEIILFCGCETARQQIERIQLRSSEREKERKRKS